VLPGAVADEPDPSPRDTPDRCRARGRWISPRVPGVFHAAPVQPSFAGAEGAAAGPSQHQTCRLRPGDGSRLRRKSRPLVVVRPSCYCPPFGAPGAFRSGTGGQVARYSCARRYKPEGILDIASIRQLPARKSSRKRAKICFVVISAWTITGMVQLCQSHQFSRWPQR